MEKLTDAIGIVLFESEKFGCEKVLKGGGCPTIRANKTSSGVIEIMADVNVIGSLEAKFESTNRIYDVGGCSPTLSTMQGGNQEPKILEAKQLGFMDNGTGKHQSNTVYDENALCHNITTVEGGGTQQIKICESQIVAMCGRNPDNPSDRTVGSPTEQRLEMNMQGTSNCLTSVQKDNSSNACAMALNSQPVGNAGGNSYLYNVGYRIRKLTPRECGRLMGVSDEDIDKMAAVNSNTQLYKQFGNSIVVDVMCAMFKNLNIDQKVVLKSGDTIKCSDEEDMIKTMNELEKYDIQTDFLYEKDGEKGYWLEIL